MRALISFFFLSCYVNPAWSNSSTLNIYLWEDTLSPQVIESWQSKYNTPVHISHFDNDDERSLLMMKSTQLPFDIVLLDNISANIYGNMGSFEPLTDLPNRKYNDSKWNQACGDYAVPYFWGTVGIAYRKDLIKQPPATWQEFVHPKEELIGKIGMIDDTIDTFLPLFYSLGLSPVTDNRSEIQQAYPALQDFSQRVLTFDYLLSYFRSHGITDKLQMALAYSGDHYSLNRLFGQDIWGYTLPEGETYVWVDCLAINSHSKNKKVAKEFLNYLSDPIVAAINATDIKAATPNLRALKLVPDWYRNDASLFPSNERMENSYIDSILSAENISLRTKIINRIVKNHEAQY